MPILKGYMPFSISNESYKDEKIESVQKKMFRAQPQPPAPENVFLKSFEGRLHHRRRRCPARHRRHRRFEG